MFLNLLMRRLRQQVSLTVEPGLFLGCHSHFEVQMGVETTHFAPN